MLIIIVERANKIVLQIELLGRLVFCVHVHATNANRLRMPQRHLKHMKQKECAETLALVILIYCQLPHVNGGHSWERGCMFDGHRVANDGACANGIIPYDLFGRRATQSDIRLAPAVIAVMLGLSLEKPVELLVAAPEVLYLVLAI